MTFDRWYSIIRPHKTVSFDAVKRAKITIVCILLISILNTVPHYFISAHRDLQCIPYAKVMDKVYGQFYYWFTIVISFFLPFVLLLTMNCVIIHVLRQRSSMFNAAESQGQGHNKGHTSQIKTSEKQIYVMLLLVSFGFLICTTPGYVLIFL